MPPPPPPPAPPVAVRFGAYGGKTSVFVDARATAAWSASLESAAWLAFAGPADGTGPGLVTLAAPPSTGAQRSGTLVVRIAGESAPRAWPVVQASALPLATLNASVLATPFPGVPTVMELGIAGGYVAEQIQDIPEPFDLIALAVVELIVLALGALAIALRAALAPVVPEPRTWFGAPEPFTAFASALPATGVFLVEETLLLAAYILEQTLDGGE